MIWLTINNTDADSEQAERRSGKVQTFPLCVLSKESSFFFLFFSILLKNIPTMQTYGFCAGEEDEDH